MNREERISTKQLAVLILFVMFGDMLLVLPPIVADEAKQDAWIAGLFGIFAGLLVAWLLFAFAKSIGPSGLVEQNRRKLGVWAGGCVTVLYLLYFLFNTSLMVRQTADFLTTQLFPETPLRAIGVLAIFVMVVGAKYGLETIARTGEVFFPIFVILFAALLLMLVPQIEAEKLQPMMATSVPDMMRGTLLAAAYPFCQLCVMLMVLPHVTGKRHLARDYGIAVALGGLGNFAVILFSVLVLGGAMTAYFIHPVYVLSQKISIGHFLERLEAVIAVNLILSTYMKMVLYFYAFLHGTAQLFGTGDYRRLAFPTGMILFGLALFISPNIIYYNDVIMRYWADLDLIAGVALPLLLLALYRIRGKTKQPPSPR